VPAVHGEHVPLLQTMLAPHVVPFGLLVVSPQVEMPDAHVVAPFLHMFEGGQGVPAVHPEHAPLLQTWLVPHDVPFGLLPVSAHIDTPEAHEVAPVLHTFPGEQVVPAVQAEHTPLLHTKFVPHSVPLDLLPVSAQTDAPVTHDVVPVLHTFGGWQLAPPVHDTHAPLLHTRLAPHMDPLTRLVPVSAQLMGAQEVKPAWQGLVGVHASPAVHATHWPALHTKFVPQLVPLATFPVAVQTGPPVLHVVVPVRQGWLGTEQLVPDIQVPHVPVPLQTRLSPHDVPGARLVPVSVQVGLPVEHARVPM